MADRWGDVVEYTLTIEQIGGSAMVVPGRGFLLNNELTDFNFRPTQGRAPDPNLPAPGKRPRSSMSPTILLDRGHPYLAVGSPGGATIITTVLQILDGRHRPGHPGRVPWIHAVLVRFQPSLYLTIGQRSVLVLLALPVRAKPGVSVTLLA